MPEAPPPVDRPPESMLHAARRDARDRLQRFNSAVLTRLNLGGLLAVAGIACALDFASAGDILFGTILTALQIVLAFPWGYAVLSLDRTETRLVRRERGTRAWGIFFRLTGFLAVGATLLSKALILHEARVDHFLPESGGYRQWVVLYFALVVTGLLGRGNRAERVLASVADHPARLMAMSFGLAALLGGFLLTLPISVRPEVDLASVTFVDGLFTATSAVCVTGLTVNRVSETYSTFGQVVLLLLMQAGGLGIMSLAAFFAIVSGRRLRVRSTAVLAEMIDADSMAALRRTLRHIVIFTLTIEAVGAAFLYVSFFAHPNVDMPPGGEHPASGPGGAMWAAVFHSVSAYCNAGFSICRDNMVAFGGSWSVSATVAVLVTLGGLGYPVLDELWRRFRDRLAGRAPPRLSLHSRVVLVTSALLVAVGTLAFLGLEWNRTLDGRPAHERLLASGFQSVTTRTAGFNTLDFGAMAPPIILVSCFLMFVGASPGSTGGGIKTTTFATLLAALRGETKGRETPHLLDRALPTATVRRALGVAVISLAIQMAVIFVLLLTETDLLARYRGDALGPLRIVFEVMSAFATCGLSTGITAELSVAGKLVLAFTMFVGRIGPLTLALAAASKPRSEPFAPAEERLLIG